MATQNALQFTLHGDHPEEAAALKKILEEAFGAEVATSRPSAAANEQTKSAEALAVISLVLSVPAAILAIDTLADRLTRKQQVEQVDEQVKRLVKTTRVKVTVTLPEGRTKSIEKVTTTEMLDQLDQSHK